MALPPDLAIAGFLAHRDEGQDASKLEMTSLVEVALGADQELPVALVATPLVAGALRITGIRCAGLHVAGPWRGKV